VADRGARGAQLQDDLAALGIVPAHPTRARPTRARDDREDRGAARERHAYEAEGNVYFDVRSFPRYGALSGNTLAELEAGRVGAREDQRRSATRPTRVWKRDPKHLMQWDSPFGRGFRLHIECSAMSRRYLGDTLDIHTGGPDNKFPHHECDIAQSERVPLRFVRHGSLAAGSRSAARRWQARGRPCHDPSCSRRVHGRGPAPLSLRHALPLAAALRPLAARRGAKTRTPSSDHFVHYEMAERPEGPDEPAVAQAIETGAATCRRARRPT